MSPLADKFIIIDENGVKTLNKLKARFLKARSLLSIKTYKRPMLFVILMMVLLNLVILSIAAIIALFIDDSFTGFIDAFANGSLKWMLTPNAILAITNPKTLFLAVVVLVIGIVLFSGTIIALTTNAIKEYFQKKKSGSGKIYLSRHIVVLNWNSKVPELVADLLNIASEEVTVMILASVDKESAEKQILNAIRALNRNNRELTKLNILVKHGDPLSETDLVDISIEESSAILIMNKDEHDEVVKDMSRSDLNVIKTILSLGRIEFKYAPPIVAEIKNIETKAKILTMSEVVGSIHEHKLLPICFDRRLGQIIAQTIINPLMEDVYLSLFSFEGSEVYQLPDTDFETCLKECSHSIPLARIGKELFVLSLSDETKAKRTHEPFDTITLKTKPIVEATALDVHIIGANNKLAFILDSFREYEHLHQSQFKAEWIAEEKIPELVAKVNLAAHPATFVLLSDERQATESLDANVIDNLIYLEGHLNNPDVNIIVELLDPKNDHIVKDFNIRNTIISNKIISLLLSKLALFKETAPFYDNLLTISPNQKGEDDQAIIIKKADSFIDESFPIVFSSVKSFVASLYQSCRKKVIPMGYFRNDQLRIFSGDMHKREEVSLEKDDLVILMKL